MSVSVGNILLSGAILGCGYVGLVLLNRGAQRHHIAQWVEDYNFLKDVPHKAQRDKIWRDYYAYRDTSFWFKVHHEMPYHLEDIFGHIDFELDYPHFYNDDLSSDFIAKNSQFRPQKKIQT